MGATMAMAPKIAPSTTKNTSLFKEKSTRITVLDL